MNDKEYYGIFEFIFMNAKERKYIKNCTLKFYSVIYLVHIQSIKDRNIL